MSERVTGLTNAVAGALSPHAGKIQMYNNLATTEGLPSNHSAASSSTTPRSSIVPTAASFGPTKGGSLSVMPPPPPHTGGAKAKGIKPPAAAATTLKKHLPNLSKTKATPNYFKVKNDADIKAGAKSIHEVKMAPEVKATGSATKNVTPPANPIKIEVNAATARNDAALPNSQQNNAGQENSAKNINSPPPPPPAATADSDTTAHTQGGQQQIDADATQKWIDEQHALRTGAGNEDVFKDKEEVENDVTIQDVIKDGWEKVKEAKDMSKKYCDVEHQHQIDIQLYKNHFDTLKSQVARKKKEKKLRKRQKKEVLELSDAQIKAQEEGSTAYYLVQNSRKEIDQYLAQIYELQKEVNALDDNDSDEDKSDESSVGEEDSQTTNEGGVFSSTQNNATEVTPEKNGAAKKKKKNKSTPKRRRNASRFPPNDLGPLDGSINKVSRV